MTGNESLREPAAELRPGDEAGERPRSIAPVWHTVLLLAGILALSIHGAMQFASGHVPQRRTAVYATTAVMELVMLAWVAFGLRLRRVRLRSLFGSMTGGARALMLDAGMALVFWVGAMLALGTLGVVWSGVEAAVTHQAPEIRAGHTMKPGPEQQKIIRVMAELAPANGEQIAEWILLCILVGIVEEAVFRGYLQQQFTAWARGGAAAGVVFSALAFGAAHGYQGVRNMILLTVFGALFSLLALYRRGLRPGIFAHSWHDLIAGLALAFLRAHKLI